MEAGLARLAGWPVGEIPLERDDILPSGMKVFPYKHSKRAGPVAEVEPIFIISYVS